MSKHTHVNTQLPHPPVFSLPSTSSKISVRADTSTRRRHIRLLNDILHLSIQRGQWDKANRAWAILARCPEVDWRAMWHIGLLLIGKQHDQGGGLNLDDGSSLSATTSRDRVDYLKTLMLRYPTRRESLLRELSLELISQERYTEALDELELYLPIFPYHDNPILHLYAGLLCLYLAQKRPSEGKQLLSSSSMPASLDISNLSTDRARSAQRYLDRAKTLDPENPTASTFLALLEGMFPQAGRIDRDEDEMNDEDDDDDSDSDDDEGRYGDVQLPPPESVDRIGVDFADAVDEAWVERGAKKVRVAKG
ncbi:hypothetical protein FRB95_001483 [Tulasnella sp. JGI-2019a]|nr:hypothetical protein FRB95_001483 [Tulasnella sp. JGI-2019a]